MRKTIICVSIGALILVALYLAWDPNTLSKAPLKWVTELNDSESIRHIDEDAVYCASEVSGARGSRASICRVNRDTGEVAWRRIIQADGEIWESFGPRCWTSDTCFASGHSFDRKSKQVSNTRISAISLDSGAIRWEVPVSDEVRGIRAYENSLLCLTLDGRLSRHYLQNGEILTELDLSDFIGPCIFDNIQIYGNMAVIIGRHRGLADKNFQTHTIINIKTNEFLGQYSSGYPLSETYIVYDGESYLAYDTHSLEARTDSLKDLKHCLPLSAVDDSGVLLVQLVGRSFRLLDGNAEPTGLDFDQRTRVLHMSKDTAFFSDRATLRSINRPTGDTNWTVQVSNNPHYLSSSEQQIAVVFDEGLLQVVDTETGTAKWTYKLIDRILSPAYCKDGRVIIRDGNSLKYFGN